MKDTMDLKHVPLSNFDLIELEPNIKITLSNDLGTLRNADELVNQQGVGVLLFQFPPTKNGHWLGLIRKRDTFEVFDSFGNTLKSLPKDLRIKDVGQSQQLEDLIRKSGYKLIQNRKRLQGEDASCGRWVMLRLLFHQYSIDEFHQILKQFKDELHIDPLKLAILSTFDINMT